MKNWTVTLHDEFKQKIIVQKNKAGKFQWRFKFAIDSKSGFHFDSKKEAIADAEDFASTEM